MDQAYNNKSRCTNPNCKCDNCVCTNCQCGKNMSGPSAPSHHSILEQEQNNKMNSLYTKEECPKCHFAYVSGFSPNNSRICPSCRANYTSGQRVNHGPSCTTCLNRYHGSNNVYYKDGCPAIMSDGRFITYYNSTNELTEAMRKMNGFNSANQFRNFMQKNGDQFMDAERNHIIKENTCSPSVACSEGWYNLWTKYGGTWAGQAPSICPI